MVNRNKIIIYSIILFAVLILLFVFISNKNSSDIKMTDNKEVGSVDNNASTTAAVSSSTPAEFYVPKKLEFVTETEKTEQLGVWVETGERIQVIARDENGKITAYKIIRSDEDVVQPRD